MDSCAPITAKTVQGTTRRTKIFRANRFREPDFFHMELFSLFPATVSDYSETSHSKTDLDSHEAIPAPISTSPCSAVIAAITAPAVRQSCHFAEPVAGSTDCSSREQVAPLSSHRAASNVVISAVSRGRRNVSASNFGRCTRKGGTSSVRPLELRPIDRQCSCPQLGHGRAWPLTLEHFGVSVSASMRRRSLSIRIRSEWVAAS